MAILILYHKARYSMSSKFSKAYIEELAYKWEKGLLTDSERADFEAWYNGHNDEYVEIPANYDREEGIRNRLLSQLEFHMNAGHRNQGPRRRPIFYWIAAASIILFMFSIGTYIYQREPAGFGKKLLIANNDINPGSNKAILTLADGRKINLDSVTHGELAEESGIKITKTEEGQLVYEIISVDKMKQGAESKGEENVETRYNTIETPKGGQYKIVLPDRSYVWLNAASTLKYPTNFAMESRIVELKGEAYFEIARDRQRPFLVKSKDQVTEVLGTQFNISAYDDEETVKTTLVKGAVSVTPTLNGKINNDRATILKPGEQSSVLKGKASIAKVDLAPYIAWKNGVFYFDETKITDAMNQLSRWYDVEIVYKGEVSSTYFYGEISRTKTLAAVLAILQEGGVKFKIEKTVGANKLIVY